MSGRVYFIGDLHLGHKKILQFGQRSHFADINEHDFGMVENWNSVVKKQRDLVWVLGDVAFNLESLQLLMMCNGRKILVAGNHDHFSTEEYLKYFERVIAVEKRYKNLVMTHIPIHPNELCHRGWEFNVHGHIHDPAKGLSDPRYINCNADAIGLKPISLEEIKERTE